jgi:hypothetical protein
MSDYSEMAYHTGLRLTAFLHNSLPFSFLNKFSVCGMFDMAVCKVYLKLHYIVLPAPSMWLLSSLSLIFLGMTPLTGYLSDVLSKPDLKAVHHSIFIFVSHQVQISLPFFKL